MSGAAIIYLLYNYISLINSLALILIAWQTGRVGSGSNPPEPDPVLATRPNPDPIQGQIGFGSGCQACQVISI